jgi:transcription-repair coupling factor (superfamily II helicase)
MPGHTIVTVPAWDCLPYDRVSPNSVTISARMTALAALTSDSTRGIVVLTAVNALIQRLPPREIVATMSFSATAGQVVDSDRLVAWAAGNGYLRVPTVREPGEYAVRGGLIDLYPAGTETPLRFDFFGKQLESIRSFDAESQRTTGTVKSVALAPMSEVLLSEDNVRRFRLNYTTAFGGDTRDDVLYQAVVSALSGHRALAAVLLRPPRLARRLYGGRPLHLRRPGARGLRRAAGADPRLLRGARAGAKRKIHDERRALQARAARKALRDDGRRLRACGRADRPAVAFRVAG